CSAPPVSASGCSAPVPVRRPPWSPPPYGPTTYRRASPRAARPAPPGRTPAGGARRPPRSAGRPAPAPTKLNARASTRRSAGGGPAVGRAATGDRPRCIPPVRRAGDSTAGRSPGPGLVPRPPHATKYLSRLGYTVELTPQVDDMGP